MNRAAGVSRYEHWQQRCREPILTALLVLLSCEIFVSIPLTSGHSAAASIFATLRFVLIVATALIATRNRKAAAAMLVTAAMALGANVLRLDEPSILTLCVGAASCAVFMLLLCLVLWSVVYGPGPVTHHRVRGAVVIYLSIALAFAAIYELLLALVPGAIGALDTEREYLVVGKDLMYYSLGTLTSIGAGESYPIHPIARSLTILEAAVGQLFPAIFVARIVAMEIPARRE
ncbi:MAG: potassium channel family protein [Pseudomonadota bacterium]